MFIGGSQGSYDAKVGIGVTSPVTPLHVNSDGSTNGIMSNQILRITPADGNNGINIGSDGTDGMIGVTNNDTDLHFLSRTGGSYSKAMTIDGATGNVGIGTTSPTGQNANGPILHLFGTNATGTLNEPQIVFQQTGEPAMSIGANANLDSVPCNTPST